MPSLRRVLYVSAIGAALAVLPAPAVYAQQPAAQTVTSTGVGEADVDPSDRKDEKSIRDAVVAANAKALPLAVANARTHAAELAAAAGLKLGALISISDAPAAGVPFFYLPQNGTFGNGRFCGKVRNTKTVVRNGRRRRVPVKGTHKVCRVPPEVYTSVSITFAVTP